VPPPTNPVPEPDAIALLALGGVLLCKARKFSAHPEQS